MPENYEETKERIYKINLTPSEVKKIAQAAGNLNMSVDEYIKDRILRDTDEDVYDTDLNPEKRSLITFLNSMESCYSYDSLMNAIDEVKAVATSIGEIVYELDNPEECDWQIYSSTDAETGKIIQAYKSLDEYLAEQKKILEDEKDNLKYAKQDLLAIQEDFNKYMGRKEYSWIEELALYKEWYRQNVSCYLK